MKLTIFALLTFISMSCFAGRDDYRRELLNHGNTIAQESLDIVSGKLVNKHNGDELFLICLEKNSESKCTLLSPVMKIENTYYQLQQQGLSAEAIAKKVLKASGDFKSKYGQTSPTVFAATLIAGGGINEEKSGYILLGALLLPVGIVTEIANVPVFLIRKIVDNRHKSKQIAKWNSALSSENMNSIELGNRRFKTYFRFLQSN